MREHESFLWPPPSDDLEAIEVLDLDTGRPLRVCADATAPPPPPIALRPEPASTSEFNWPPVDDLAADFVTLDAGSPWPTTGDVVSGAGMPTPAPRTSTGAPVTLPKGSALEAEHVVPHSLVAGLSVPRRAPAWASYAAAVLVCGAIGVAIAPHVGPWRGAMVSVHAGDESALPPTVPGGPLDRSGAELLAGHAAQTYSYADLRLPRGLGDDRAASRHMTEPGADRDPAPSRADDTTGSTRAAMPVPTLAMAVSTAPPALVTSAAALPSGPAPSGPAPSGPALSPPLPGRATSDSLHAESSLAAASPLPVNPVAAPEASLTNTTAATRVETAVAHETRDRARIEATLDRYRTAYASLDAAAARSVWPSVDQRALERAFGSLKSQGLDFEGCTTDLQGTNATVACRGRATYVPRIGSQRPRTEEHQWRFRLRKVDESWMILTAEAR